jgi:hypothetical protein
MWVERDSENFLTNLNHNIPGTTRDDELSMNLEVRKPLQ